MTPEQFGEAAAQGIMSLPLLAAKAEVVQGLMARIGADEPTLLGERYLLCAVATERAIRNASLPQSVEVAMLAGFHGSLKRSGAGQAQYAARFLEAAMPYYSHAADSDAKRAQPVPSGELSQIELAFGNRLFDLGAATQERADICFLLADRVPKVLWDAQFSGTTNALADFGFANKPLSAYET